MKEKTKPLALADNPFGKIKGHTKIILTSVKDGSQKIIEHDNVFQSGVLAKFMKSFGQFNASPYGNSTFRGQPIWRNLCGGIFCFKNAIDTTNGEVEYMPAGNEMVANGAYGVTNSGTPVELGTYNALESVTDGNASVTFVYDWGTSQGNGTINSVCLTSEIGGYIGYGNASGERIESGRDFFANQTSQSADGVIYKNMRWQFSVDADNKVLTVTKTPIAVTQAGIMDGIAKNAETYPFTLEYTVTTSYSANYTAYVHLGGAEVLIYLTRNTYVPSIGNGETWYAIIWNMDTHAFRQCTVINNTGYDLKLDIKSLIAHDNTLVIRQYYDTASGRSYAFAFDMTTGQLVAETEDLSHDTTTYANSPQSGFITSDLLIDDHWLWDMVAETQKPINNICNTTRRWDLNDFYGGVLKYGGLYKNPLFLATINNLAEPVVKDNTQTMKIMYTLTEV